MNVFITGGTGFVGRHLSQHLLNHGHRIKAIGTSPSQNLIHHENFTYIPADATRPGDWQKQLQGVDVVVNLAGRTIFKRWTESYKRQIYDSRVLTTRNVVAALPDDQDVTLCSTSAVGFYGSRGDDILREDEPAGDDFLALLGQDWESAALKAEDKGIRVVLPRFGIALGKGGGAMAKMMPVFKMGVGGPLGDGRQWFPWIHMRDLIDAIAFVISNSQVRGALNFTAPNPVTNKELSKALGGVLMRPAFLPTPKAMLRLMMGEMGEVLLASQRAIPDRLLSHGFQFRFPDLKEALEDLVT